MTMTGGLTDLQDRYDCGRVLGSGVGGVVYQARDLVAGGDVAIKYFPPTPGRPRPGLREFSLHLSLRHPRVASCLDFFYLHDGGCALVCSYAGSTTLRDLINARPGPWPIPVAAAVLAQVLDGLAYLHAAGVVHRDLKPENIVVDGDLSGAPVITLVDFGLAWLHVSAACPAPAGTPSYLSPEAAYDKAGPAADLYAAGVIFYELLAGRRPFDGEPREILRRQLDEAPELASIHHPGLGRLLLRLLAKDPRRRPGATTAINELAEALAGDGLPEATPGPAPKPAACGSSDDLNIGGARERVGEFTVPDTVAGVYPLIHLGRPALMLDHGMHFELVDAAGGRACRVLRSKDPAPLVLLADNAVAYALRGEIRRWSATDDTTVMAGLGLSPARFTLGSDGRVFWTEGGRLASHDPASGRTRVVPLRGGGLVPAFGGFPAGGWWAAGGVVEPRVVFYDAQGVSLAEEPLPGVVTHRSTRPAGTAFFVTRVDRNGWAAALHAAHPLGLRSRHLPGVGGDVAAFAFPAGGLLVRSDEDSWSLYDELLEHVGVRTFTPGVERLEFSSDNRLCVEITRRDDRLVLATHRHHDL
jgi:hypothetical protein